MRVRSLTQATALLTIGAFALSVGTAHAAPLTAADAKCRAAIAKGTGKLASTISKAFDGCVKAAAKAGSGNCQTTAAADTKSKVPGAKTKVTDGITKSCDDTAAAVALAEHAICGTPVGGALASFAAVGTCLNQLNDANVQNWRAAILNPNYSVAQTNKNVNKCVGAIGKNATKLLATIQKEQSKVQNTSDKALGDSNYANSGLGGKIAGAITKTSDGITKACSVLTAGEWGAVGSCDDDLAGAIQCITNKTIAVAQGLVASAYDQPGHCPSAVQVKIHHGAAEGVKLGPTELDVGWTGFGHNADVIDGFVGRVNLDCGGPTGNDCTNCQATASCSEGNCRCSNDVTQVCSTPFVQSTCGVGNTCELYFGPPLALSAAGTPTCVVNKITEELVNTANVATGESDTAIENRATVHTGISQSQPCPTCVAGSCVGGARNGQACAVNGSSAVFGAVSYDCPPTALSNISGAGLKISLNLTDDLVSMPFALPCDPPLGILSCACSTCTGDNTLGCNSDAECAAAGAGTCRTDGSHGGAQRVPNGCNGACVALSPGSSEGVCDGAGPSDSYCSGLVKSNGEGIITCANDGDCAALNSECPGGDCGTCTLTSPRKCFLNPIVADGTANPEGSVLVSNFCSSPTASGAVNSAAGTPGPARLALDFEFLPFCSNGTTLWGTGGAACQ
jgi:hypothetical protein